MAEREQKPGTPAEQQTLTIDELVDLLRRTRPPSAEDEARRGVRAWLLAPDILTYQALMRGETVTLSALNADAARRYGLRR